MVRAAVPDVEARRLQALRSYMPRSLTDAALDSLVRAASLVCDVPIALISLVEQDRQWFAAGVGLPGLSETPRDIAFCAHAILSPDVMVVEDAVKDPRFADNPLVVGDQHFRFYAGAPLIDAAGFELGTLCVLDRIPRALSPTQLQVLRELSIAAMRVLEARRADRLVAETKEALDTVLSSVSARVAYWDGNLVNRFANPAFAKLAGVASEDLRGQPMKRIVGERVMEIVAPAVEAALRGESRRVAFDAPGRDGRIEHTDVTFTPDVQDGVIVGCVGTAVDVTALKNALLVSEQRNALLSLAEELAEVGHWRIDVGREGVFWSPQVFRIYGRDPATFVPTQANAIEAFHPEDRAHATEAVARAAERGEPFDLELRLLRADGAVRYVESKGRCEIDPVTNMTRSVFGVFHDVTERRRARDLAAHQDRLITTGTLAAGVGHEINNPLTYVSANIDFALEELRLLAGSSPAGRMLELLEVLGEAREGAERIRKIVRGLRAFARADEPLAPTSLEAALDISVNMSASELRGTATVRLDVRDAPLVMADESRLSQVFVNILVNAAQAFTTKDAERNQIVVRRVAAPAGRIAIEVSDNGPGIPSQVLPRIFDPFFTTKEIGRGSGLGLAISHTNVAAFGGELTCTTEVGEGTTFRLVLPAAPDAPLQAPSRDVPESSPKPRKNGRILVVDDEDVLRRSMDRVLRGEHEVVMVADPREAVRLLLEQRAAFDLVLCDLMMPHMSGMELFALVKDQLPAMAERFVFITGGAVGESARTFLDEVPNERLEKPFSNQNLRALARRFASRSA